MYHLAVLLLCRRSASSRQAAAKLLRAASADADYPQAEALLQIVNSADFGQVCVCRRHLRPRLARRHCPMHGPHRGQQDGAANGSRFAQVQVERHRRLAPVADLPVSRMERSISQQNATAWRLVPACLVPLVLLCVYLFVFRWSWRFFSIPDDYIAVTACALLGAITIGVQPLRFSLRAVSIVLHIGLSIALFSFCRLLSRPVLNDVF
jgi:hypothetical protein